MQPRDAVDDREPQARARCAVAARARRAGARERLLQALDVLGGNAAAAVGDVDDRRAVGMHRRHLDRRRAVRERVVDEVGDEARDRRGLEVQRRQDAAGEPHRLARARVAVDARADDRVEVGRLERRGRITAREVQELSDDPVHLVDVRDHAGAQRLVGEPHLDAEPQPGERRAQVVGDAGQQQRAVLLDPRQVARHRVEAAVDRGDLGRAGLGQRRRHLAAADPHYRRVEVAQRAGEIAREAVGGREQEREHDERPHERARRELVGRRPRGHGDADPVGRARRDDAHEQRLRARREPDLGLRPQPLAQPLRHLLHQRARRRLAAHRALGLGNDAHAVFAGQPLERFPALRAVGAGERCAQRLQLDEPRLAELPLEHRRTLGAERDDAHEHRQRDDRHQQQHEAPEQRARQQGHAPSPPGSGPAPAPGASVASGT